MFRARAVVLAAAARDVQQAYLLGTAHVSERSERAVRQVISAGDRSPPRYPDG